MKFRLMKKCTALLCAAVMLASSSGNISVYSETVNLITNSTFDSGIDGWSQYSRTGAAAELFHEEGKLALAVSALGDLNYAVQLSSNEMTLNQGSYYKVTFDISSTADRYIDAIVQQNGGSYTAFSAQGINLKSEVQSVEIVFAMTSDTAEAKLVFNCGNHGEVLDEHTIYIDNVVICETDAGAVEEYAPYEPPIVINQIGYKPESEKIAVFRDITSETEFSVINSDTNEVVYTGVLYGKKENTTANEINLYGDFSSVTEQGSYYITCGELDDSYTFEIAYDVYDSLLDDTVKMLYLQRCGCEVNDETFGHAACHAAEATVYGTDLQIDVSGGWHDAGDYGRYVVPAAKTIADLLLAYEANPKIHSDSIGIPESGNGIPDILDEARYEIEWMLKMQSESGGVYHQVTTSSLPGSIMPDKDLNQLVVDPISTTATADFCAVMAMAYEHYYSIDKEFAENCLAAAEKAWAFLEVNPDITYNETGDFVADTYIDSNDSDERFWAISQLYRATKDDKYKNAIPVISGTYYERSIEWHAIGGYGIIALLTMEDADTDFEAYTAAKNAAVFQADEYMTAVETTGYGTAITKFSWGSNMTVANAGILLKIAYDVTGDERYLSAVQTQLNYVLGRNPNGMCYVTGYGTVSPQNPHHRPSIVQGQAMKGMLVGGVNSALSDPEAEKYLSDVPADKCYIDNSGSYSTNEITIYWNSPLIYLISLTEDEAVVGDINGDNELNVSDIVMLQNHLLGRIELTTARLDTADVCRNGIVDVFDMIKLRELLISGL